MSGRTAGLGLVLLLLFLWFLVGPLPARGEAPAGAPEINGRAGVLIDAESGRLLWSYRGQEPLPPASTTKIMTGLLALEKLHPDEIVHISPRAQAQTGSRVFLTSGETYRVRELVEALLLASANDAAVALAEHMSGSVEEFAREMNRRARELGAAHSNFCNPHGLPDDDHLTSAYDLALITREAMQNEDFARLVATRESTMSWPGRDEDRVLYNRNRLLSMDEELGMDGVKTGFTSAAGNCLVGSSTRDGQQLLAVVLGGSPDTYFGDVRDLLQFGFDNYPRRQLVGARQEVARVQPLFGVEDVGAQAADEVAYPLASGETDGVKQRLQLHPDLEAPLTAGEPVGELVLYLEGEEIGRVALQAEHDVDRHILAHPALWLGAGALVVLVLVALLWWLWRGNSRAAIRIKGDV